VESPITLGADLGLSFYIAVAIVVGVNGVKWIFVKLPWLWTNRIPDWAWMAWAWFFAIGACLLLKVDVLSKLFGSADFSLNPPWAYVASGFAIGISSNVLYTVIKPITKKLKVDGKIVCLPPGTPLPDSQNGNVVPEAPVVQDVQHGQESQQPSMDAGSSIQQTEAQQPEVSIPAEPIAVDSSIDISKNGVIHASVNMPNEQTVSEKQQIALDSYGKQAQTSTNPVCGTTATMQYSQTNAVEEHTAYVAKHAASEGKFLDITSPPDTPVWLVDPDDAEAGHVYIPARTTNTKGGE
jgi:hypothetical protein